LEADAIVRYSDEEKIWVAAIDWDKIREVAEVETLLLPNLRCAESINEE
jgi:hypothetical protein